MSWALPASAQPATVASGTVIAVFGDPSDFVVELSNAGRCGSRYFHIRRANANFREMVAVTLTAFSTSRPMGLFVTSCAGDRNIISHGYASR
jgi:hypothetical protein